MAKDVTRAVVTRQLDAMGVDAVEVGVSVPADPADPDSKAKMLLRSWTRADLFASLGWLKHQNYGGGTHFHPPGGQPGLSVHG